MSGKSISHFDVITYLFGGHQTHQMCDAHDVHSLK